MIEQPKPPAQEPRFEPEIIPPGQVDGQSMHGARGYVHMQGVHRVYVGKVGPFGLVLLALLVAIFIAVILVVLLGAVLIWIPVVTLLVAAGVISSFLRR